MHVDPTTFLRDSGLRVTKQRVAVLEALADRPHSGAEAVLKQVRREVGRVSTQAIYDVLNTLTDRGLLRRIQPAGSSARYELRVGDNHHHVVCRKCGSAADIECATGDAPCLDADDPDRQAPGFVIDEAEVTFWGVCSTCSSRPTPADTSRHQPPDISRPTSVGGEHGQPEFRQPHFR